MIFHGYLILKNGYRDNFWCEVNNKETFFKIIDIYSCNSHNFDLDFTFVSSGFAVLKKKTNEKLNKIKKKVIGLFLLKNFLRF